MSKEPANKPIATFKNYCTCGGYAWQMNGRPESQPHMDYCPQREEYARWFLEQMQLRNAGQSPSK